MKFILDKFECWIKDDVVLPLNFNFMNDQEKWLYIQNNKLFHREGGPAIIYHTGFEEWDLNGKCHRLDGPAIIYPDGYKTWYLNDIRVDGKIYQKIQNSSKEELLVYMINPGYKDYLSLIEYRLNQ